MKAVVCGAGIAGLTLAHRLASLGWDVVVLERAPGPRAQGYMIDFFGAGYEAFTRGTGGRLLSIMRPDLELALRGSLPDTVGLRFSTSPARIENGADGVHSAVRCSPYSGTRPAPCRCWPGRRPAVTVKDEHSWH